MICPKCQQEMKPVAFGTVQVDRCTHCLGIWFDAHEAEALRNVAGAEEIDAGSGRVGGGWSRVYKVNCPRCGVPLERRTDRTRPHIKFEICPKCDGAFFDAGEFRHYKEDTFLDYLRTILSKDILSSSEEP